MANKSRIGLIRKFTKTGNIGGAKLLIVIEDDINDDNTLEKDTDRFLIANVDYIKRNKQGELNSIVFTDDETEYPYDMSDLSVGEMEVFEIIEDKVDEHPIPTCKQLALWLREEYGRAVLTEDGLVIMTLAYNINVADEKVNRIVKYTDDLDNDKAWKDISEFFEDQVSSGDEYWKIVK